MLLSIMKIFVIESFVTVGPLLLFYKEVLLSIFTQSSFCLKAVFGTQILSNFLSALLALVELSLSSLAAPS